MAWQGNASLFHQISPSFGQAVRQDCPKDGLLPATVRHYGIHLNDVDFKEMEMVVR